MLRIQRLTQFLIALCATAFVSAVISLVTYRVLSLAAAPIFGPEVLAEIRSVTGQEALKDVCTAFVGAALDLRTSGAFLASWGLWFVLFWSAILGAAALMLYRQLAYANDKPALPERETIVDLALSGRLELWKVFWGLYVGLSLAPFLRWPPSCGC